MTDLDFGIVRRKHILDHIHMTDLPISTIFLGEGEGVMGGGGGAGVNEKGVQYNFPIK